MRYDPIAIQPFRDELTKIGFRELRTVTEVDTTLMETPKGTNLLVINSVCGCAAGKARPGITLALRKSAVRPDSLTTVFAGGDIEATARVREILGNIPPSSPSMALFKNGELVHFVPRYQIENRDATQIAEHLIGVFQEHCGSPVNASQQ
ncbi:MAG: BrxA/BrxB family bacilliredoxin [Ignavibacteria bacterium]|nr:BrxA/BrxB family bacilliredoxin [Ignavibacteria bacterium]